MKVRKGDTVKVKGRKVRYLITKVKGTMVRFISLNGEMTGTFDTQYYRLKVL